MAGRSQAMNAAKALDGQLGELWRRLRFLFLAICVYRIGAHIPVPGVNPLRLEQLFGQNQGTIVSLFNMFSGGALERMSILALGIMPYISASIIMQLLTSVIPSLEELKKEGESGRRKITQYTRWGTLGLGIIQALGMSIGLQSQGIALETGSYFVLTSVVSLVTGTMFLMWLGEQITERGIGNGISMIIFSGIVAGLPAAFGQSLESARQGDIHIAALLLILVIAALVICFVVFMEKAQRRLKINYANRQNGRFGYQQQESHLPLKLNMAGVIPPIFATSILLFPASIGQWVGNAQGWEWLQSMSLALGPGQPLYLILFTIGIVFFCYFYTALVFNARDLSENLKKSGAFLPGIRPGEHTAKYIDLVLGRLTLIGAIYISAVCLLPQFLQIWFNVPFYLGGTSLLIVVVVVMDLVAQIWEYIQQKQYEPLMKKQKEKGSAALFSSGRKPTRKT
ncbi:MAG: preprotein translocase subunit SecY [Pseudomonadota bacterium]